jgi:hypothetical protein
MPTPETAELLKRAGQLRLQLREPEDAARDAELAEALETLRRLARRPSLATEGAAFERAVTKALRSLPGVVVTSRQGWRGSQPDLIVKTCNGIFVIDAKARLLSSSDARRTLDQLRHARETLRANHGFLVVPTFIGATADAGREVSIVTVPELLERILDATKVNEVMRE